ncbi:hypothetical protein ACFLT2_04660 [Acidobacteriota bacterium]
MPKNGKPLFLTFIFCALFYFASPRVHAQELHGKDFNLVHWSYAASNGTGVYWIGENREVYVLRITPMFTHRFKFEKVFKDREILLEFRFPLTFGVHNFEFSELLSGGFPDSIEQISFTPGLEFMLPVSSRWNLRIFGHFGYGSAISYEEGSAWIYWGGITSRFVFPIKHIYLGLINGYRTAGYTPNHGDSGDLSHLMNGLEFKIPIGRIGSSENPFFLKPHVMNFWYYDHVEFTAIQKKKRVSLASEWEIGLAIGKSQRMKIWLFYIDRLGVGYRFGPKSNGIRIYFSSYFR